MSNLKEERIVELQNGGGGAEGPGVCEEGGRRVERWGDKKTSQRSIEHAIVKYLDPSLFFRPPSDRPLKRVRGLLPAGGPGQVKEEHEGQREEPCESERKEKAKEKNETVKEKDEQ